MFRYKFFLLNLLCDNVKKSLLTLLHKVLIRRMPTLSKLRQLAIKANSLTETQQIFVDMKQVVSLILGGGEGTRLFPLTQTRCKPAIPFGGKYRLVDIPISNSIRANCGGIYLLTQYLSASLHKHVFQTYYHVGLASGLIEILAAEQKPGKKSWYQGTADAVRQNIEYLLDVPGDYFLILSGDQLYNIDFNDMLSFAKKTDADLVVAALPVAQSDASRMGILKLNEDNFIIDFYEKPENPEILDHFQLPNTTLERMKIPHSSGRSFLGSMGIYLFKRSALIELLEQDEREDFGKHLIPREVQRGGAAAYLYDGYWEDIGTIGTFYQANMALVGPNPPLGLYDSSRPIYSCSYDLPPAKIYSTGINQAMICEGSIIEADEISQSILGPRSIVKRGSIIRDSYIFGNDFYEPPTKKPIKIPSQLCIEENCIIKGALIGENVYIGAGAQLVNKNRRTHYNGNNIYIRDGIIIVPSGASIPDGFIL